MGRTDQVLQLLKNEKSREFLESIPEARTAKIARDLIVGVAEVPVRWNFKRSYVWTVSSGADQKRNFLVSVLRPDMLL